MIPSQFCVIPNLRLSLVCKNLVWRCKQQYNRKYAARSFSSDTTVPIDRIRNFCIVAHVDHGKSTLADRLLEITGAIIKSKENKQVLDRLPVERERGITVKAVAASLKYVYQGIEYQLNLIDTPGHSDFSNEVSRSLAACQGVILLVDANEGIQAQTVSNFYLSFERGLKIIPVLNKIDLPNADPDAVTEELQSAFDIEPSSVRRISAKNGQGVEELLQCVIEEVPAPEVSRDEPFRSLVIDSWHDLHRGSVLFIYVQGGQVKVGDEIMSYMTNKNHQVKTVGKLYPEEKSVNVLQAGEVGVVTCNIRDFKIAHIGDTLYGKGITLTSVPRSEPPKPMVFAGVFPRNQAEYDHLKSAIEKLLLNDPSVSQQLESSAALGTGWRLGFLGYLHLDVFRQRLEQEFEREVVLTAPSVTYKLKIIGAKNIKKYGGDVISITNPVHFPDRSIITEMYEPVILATLMSPAEYYQVVVDECLARRGKEKDVTFLGNNRIIMKFIMPLSEIVWDFNDNLKRLTSGYASFDYEDAGYVPSSLEKLSFLLNGKEVEELVQIVHSDKVYETARKMTLKLKELIPRQQFSISIQGVIGGKVLAREDIKAYRKDVTAKLYGGDITRRQKLLKNQSEAKKKMRQFGNIQLPRDTFIDVLKEH